MKVAAIIQARLGSTRLPAKVLLPLPTGRTVLEEVIYRCKQIKGVDVVVVAIPDTAENDILARMFPSDRMFPKWSSRYEVTVVRGPEHDVLARYVRAAEVAEADVIMRITADCPLIDPDTCGAVLSIFERNQLDYVSNAWPVREVPHGWDCEVFTVEALRRAHERATEAYDREHVTPFIQRDPEAKHAILKDMQDRSHIRWTLDTLADYHVIWQEFERREREAA